MGRDPDIVIVGTVEIFNIKNDDGYEGPDQDTQHPRDWCHFEILQHQAMMKLMTMTVSRLAHPMP